MGNSDVVGHVVFRLQTPSAADGVTDLLLLTSAFEVAVRHSSIGHGFDRTRSGRRSARGSS